MNDGRYETVLTQSPEVAARFLRKGYPVAFPTETVYGLGANIYDKRAIRSIFEAKQRPSDNPLIAHISSFDQIGLLAAHVGPSAMRLIGAFFPGPLTLVLEKRDTVPGIATANLNSIGVRMPAQPVTQAFLERCGVPVVAPSANLSGRPSPTTWQAVYEDLAGRIACILQGDPSIIGLESTVVDCTIEPPVLLRPGAIGIESLRTVAPDIRTISDADEPALRKSPGTRYRHYSPKARVHLVTSTDLLGVDSPAAYIGMNEPSVPYRFELIYLAPTIEDYAYSLFSFFRKADQLGLTDVYCEKPPASGIGIALQDRIARAAS